MQRGEDVDLAGLVMTCEVYGDVDIELCPVKMTKFASLQDLEGGTGAVVLVLFFYHMFCWSRRGDLVRKPLFKDLDPI